MAWRSGGTTNDEMVNNLKRFGVINSQAVENGFRAVDRQYFVPRNQQNVAHSDQPLKEGNVHISAPHIYGSVIEALELPPDSPTSFLNIGSGTGYLSCIVAEILGPTSVNFGVELHADVLEHSQDAIQAWTSGRANARPLPMVELIHGNGLNIDETIGECRVGIDRIYIGAAVEKRRLNQLASLLKPGGILVGPVEDELVKIIRIGKSSPGAVQLQRNPWSHQSCLGDEFSLQVISGVRFAPLLRQPATRAVLPSRVWSPAVHSFYPDSFRGACKQLLLCSRASPNQPPPKTINTGLNAAALLPRALWMEVLSYTRSDWFEQPRSEEVFLRRRLHEAHVEAHRDREARMEAETRLHLVERERDIYRLLALRWQRRLQAVMSERSSGGAVAGAAAAGDDDAFAVLDDVASAAVFAADEPLLMRLGGLGAMIRRFQHDSDDDDDEEEEDEDEGVHDNDRDGRSNHEQDEMDEDSDGAADEEESMHDTSDMIGVDAMVVSSLGSPVMSSRSQARTVSITSHDL